MRGGEKRMTRVEVKDGNVEGALKDLKLKCKEVVSLLK